MSAVLVSKFENEQDANVALKFIRKHNGKSKKLNGQALDDFYFGQLIDEGMKSEDVSTEEIKKLLRRWKLFRKAH